MKKAILFIWVIFWAVNVQAQIVDRIVAVVNDEVITLSELDEAAAPLYQEYLKGVQDPAERERIKKEIRQRVLQELIDEKLINQEIERQGITVSPEEIDKFIEHFKRQNGFDDKAFQRFLTEQGLTLAKYREKVAQQIKRIKLVQSRVSQIVVTPEEIERAYQKKYGKLITKYEIAAIVISGPQAEIKIKKAYQELKKGKDFAEVAAEYSQIPDSGHSLGTFSPEELAPEVRNILAKLHPGEISPPVKVGHTWQIFKLLQVKKEKAKPLSEVKQKIEEKIRQKKIDQLLKNWQKELREQAYIRILL
ncbi:SurA domain protein [Thermodesulfatator indicus DSM 15286]|uniref:SurA domain protein n=1 Tax=Thermodesulfatator indicus (strain DSM 15286 / JCM 11887 / CIR29812) TaxID=667014 RepID=F8ACW5_THEID|nr:SurA N-terminal domain-containing protein [Thermodesulfatator indicus]AEH44758.1 SurA domain protein [Thermodesulfatator indicus DSM 15286]